ncbi:nuclear pore complex protein NUP1-like [Cornus florida]|uniref:nuclear pore complex protein NUP1-like n=1 Tax=Cornus florida TaxID=4283 RepID=UPI00289E3C4F|nr:nuclear pore complex protein NUP1-like [Cornus florida]
MLRQKTFTRSDIDRLTELLHSRSVDLPVGNENRKTEANLPKPPSAFERKDKFANTPMLKSGTENCRLHGGISTPIVSSRVREEDVASPAELAEAYMGSRPSKATTSMLALRSQAPREDATLLNNTQFSPKSSIMSLTPKSALRLGVTENGFYHPRSHGRPAIYNMAQTPYSGIYSTANQKGVKSISDGYGEPSSLSQYAWEQDGCVGSKQLARKRRSSVLDNDIGSVGPIRRIRQKINLLSPRNTSVWRSSENMGITAFVVQVSPMFLLNLLRWLQKYCSSLKG